MIKTQINRAKAKLATIAGFFILLALTICPMLEAADDQFRLDFDLTSRHTMDSSRKDYYQTTYAVDKILPSYEKVQYDKSFVSSENDMSLALRGDLNETEFLDVKENLFYQYYDPQDGFSRSYDSLKYKNLDHQLNLTFGSAVGDYDYFQLDYFNNLYDTPEFLAWKMNSNKGKVLLAHEFSERTCLSIDAEYEERTYGNDPDNDYKEGNATIGFVTYIPGRYDYRALPNSSRGDLDFFKNIPTGMDAKNAVEYYTDWQKNPRDDNPLAKYKASKTRGDSYIGLNAKFANRKRTRLDNSYNHSEIEFNSAYEIAKDICLRLNDSYGTRDYSKESNQYFLHDYSSNYLSISSSYDYSEKVSQKLTFINEYYHFKQADEESFHTNTLLFEGYYSFGQSLASVMMSGSRRNFDQARKYYPDDNETRIGIGYDYSITKNLVFRLKDDWVNKDYGTDENELYSSHSRSTWRVGVEKNLSDSQSLEVGYQEDTERHETFTNKNIDEKSLSFSWLMDF